MVESSNDKIQEVGKNIQEKAALVWSVADDLVGAFKPHEYGLVVLPMAVIKRFHDCLLPTHDKVLQTYEDVKEQIDDYILFFNEERPAYCLGYLTPKQYRENHASGC